METTTLTFASPIWFWGLAAVPVLAALYAWSHARGRTLVSKIVAPRLREQLAGSVSSPRRIVRAALVLSSLALLVIALAQPQRGFIQTEIKSKGRDVLIAVDTSRSMLATDVPPDRLTRAKLVTQDFLRLLKGDRVGLIAFAGSAFLQAPLTLDYSAVVNSLDELDTNVIPKGGTNIAAAISTAEEAFGKAEGQTRALIILTDGEELDADGIAAAKRAKDLGIRIFAIGIGSPEGSLIPFRGQDGRQDFVRDSSGKPVQSRLDSKRLSEIAEATGGFYIELSPDAARDVFQRGIEPMELTENGVLLSRQPLEQYQWPLGLSIACLLVWMLVGERRRIRNGTRTAAALLILLAASSAHAAPSAVDEYQKGDFAKANEDFDALARQSPNSHALRFNAGTSAYKLGDFDKAIADFSDGLLSEETKLRGDASYNLGNALVRRGEAAEENEAKKSDWNSAIEHYNETLKLDPKNKLAEENRDLVKKLLEELEKQEQEKKDQEDKKDDQKKDDPKKDQDKKDQQKNEDQKDQNKDDKDQQKPQDQKDQQDKKDDQKQQDQQDQKDQQGKDGEKKDENKDSQNPDNKPSDDKGKKDEPKDQKDQNSGDKKDQPAAPTPTPGEKKDGDLKSNNNQPEPNNSPEPPQQGAAPGAEEEKEGQMSAAQARGLLNSLKSEEEKVNLMQQQTSQEVLRDW